MRIKIPTLILLCAAAGWFVPCHLDAGDDKKPAETKKSEPAKKSESAKKSEPARKPESKKRTSSRKEAAEGEIKKLRDQLAENRKELDKARESLHTAQKELAEKAQVIKTLESKDSAHENALKKSNGELKKANDALKNATLNYGKASDELRKYKAMDFNKLAHSLDAERKKTAALQKQLKEAGEKAGEDLAKTNARFAAAAQKKSEPTIAPIQYDLNSAVNYEERARVLRELRAILKKSPKVKIQITGYADDTPYKETNNEVGTNRAKYLASYLRVNGVPAEQVSSRGVGSSKQGRGNGNRKAVIQVRN